MVSKWILLLLEEGKILSEVTTGETSKTEKNFLLSQDRNDGPFSHLACRVMISENTLLFLGKIRCRLMSPEFQNLTSCKPDVSRYEWWILLVLSRRIFYITKKSIFMGEVKGHMKSPEVKLQETCKPLENTLSEESSYGYFLYWL